MEAVVYRQQVGETPGLEGATGPLSLGLIYPLVTPKEMVTWTHWLPTSKVFDCTSMSLTLRGSMLAMLVRLNAPEEVLEEFRWTWNMELFEAYEVRVPVRIDARDPLLIGIAGGQCYRLALWGESLLPLEEITALVQESLAIRTCAFRRRVWLTPVSGVGFILSALLGWMGVSGSFWHPLLSLFLFFSCFLTFVAMLTVRPENCQHDFLDCYRC